MRPSDANQIRHGVSLRRESGGGELVISPYTSDAPSEVDLALKLDPAAPVAIAVDAYRDRVFLISSTGAIAVVGLRTNRIRVPLGRAPGSHRSRRQLQSRLGRQRAPRRLGPQRADPDRQPDLDHTTSILL